MVAGEEGCKEFCIREIETWFSSEPEKIAIKEILSSVEDEIAKLFRDTPRLENNCSDSNAKSKRKRYFPNKLNFKISNEEQKYNEADAEFRNPIGVHSNTSSENFFLCNASSKSLKDTKDERHYCSKDATECGRDVLENTSDPMLSFPCCSTAEHGCFEHRNENAKLTLQVHVGEREGIDEKEGDLTNQSTTLGGETVGKEGMEGNEDKDGRKRIKRERNVPAWIANLDYYVDEMRNSRRHNKRMMSTSANGISFHDKIYKSCNHLCNGFNTQHCSVCQHTHAGKPLSRRKSLFKNVFEHEDGNTGGKEKKLHHRMHLMRIHDNHDIRCIDKSHDNPVRISVVKEFYDYTIELGFVTQTTSDFLSCLSDRISEVKRNSKFLRLFRLLCTSVDKKRQYFLRNTEPEKVEENVENSNEMSEKEKESKILSDVTCNAFPEESIPVAFSGTDLCNFHEKNETTCDENKKRDDMELLTSHRGMIDLNSSARIPDKDCLSSPSSFPLPLLPSLPPRLALEDVTSATAHQDNINLSNANTQNSVHLLGTEDSRKKSCQTNLKLKTRTKSQHEIKENQYQIKCEENNHKEESIGERREVENASEQEAENEQNEVKGREYKKGYKNRRKRKSKEVEEQILNMKSAQANPVVLTKHENHPNIQDLQSIQLEQRKHFQSDSKAGTFVKSESIVPEKRIENEEGSCKKDIAREIVEERKQNECSYETQINLFEEQETSWKKQKRNGTGRIPSDDGKVESSENGKRVRMMNPQFVTPSNLKDVFKLGTRVNLFSFNECVFGEEKASIEVNKNYVSENDNTNNPGFGIAKKMNDYDCVPTRLCEPDRRNDDTCNPYTDDLMTKKNISYCNNSPNGLNGSLHFSLERKNAHDEMVNENEVRSWDEKYITMGNASNHGAMIKNSKMDERVKNKGKQILAINLNFDAVIQDNENDCERGDGDKDPSNLYAHCGPNGLASLQNEMRKREKHRVGLNEQDGSVSTTLQNQNQTNTCINEVVSLSNDFQNRQFKNVIEGTVNKNSTLGKVHKRMLEKNYSDRELTLSPENSIPDHLSSPRIWFSTKTNDVSKAMDPHEFPTCKETKKTQQILHNDEVETRKHSLQRHTDSSYVNRTRQLTESPDHSDVNEDGASKFSVEDANFDVNNENDPNFATPNLLMGNAQGIMDDAEYGKGRSKRKGSKKKLAPEYSMGRVSKSKDTGDHLGVDVHLVENHTEESHLIVANKGKNAEIPAEKGENRKEAVNQCERKGKGRGKKQKVENKSQENREGNVSERDRGKDPAGVRSQRKKSAPFWLVKDSVIEGPRTCFMDTPASQDSSIPKSRKSHPREAKNWIQTLTLLDSMDDSSIFLETPAETPEGK